MDLQSTRVNRTPPRASRRAEETAKGWSQSIWLERCIFVAYAPSRRRGRQQDDDEVVILVRIFWPSHEDNFGEHPREKTPLKFLPTDPTAVPFGYRK